MVHAQSPSSPLRTCAPERRRVCTPRAWLPHGAGHKPSLRLPARNQHPCRQAQPFLLILTGQRIIAQNSTHLGSAQLDYYTLLQRGARQPNDNHYSNTHACVRRVPPRKPGSSPQECTTTTTLTAQRLLLKNNKCAMSVRCIVLQALSYVLGLCYSFNS